MKRILVRLFIVILFIPALLTVLEAVTGIDFDISLSGYTDPAETTEVSINGVFSGKFQTDSTKLFEDKLPLRGMMTRCYNSLRFLMFHTGDLPIGKDDYVFFPDYIKAELAIDRFDYSQLTKKQELEDLVNCLASVNKKLANLGKVLYIYIASNKADLYPENVPANYKAIADPDAINAADLLQKMLAEAEIPCLFCSSLINELEVPAFYSTGIHWSRPFEQTVSKRVLSDLKKLGDMDYPELTFTGIESRKLPFWRDSDVYDLLNLWFRPDLLYYQYNVSVNYKNSGQQIELLLQGDSFAEGFRKDLTENIPSTRIRWINRDQYMIDSDDSFTLFHQAWDQLDWQRLLDCSDAVVIEISEAEIEHCTYGFASYLNSLLDHYIPKSRTTYYKSEFDGSKPEKWDLTYTEGVYGNEEAYSWLKPYSFIKLCSEQISSDGLVIDFQIPEEVIQESECDVVEIFINRQRVFHKKYTEALEESVIITPEQLNGLGGEENVYFVEISCSESFNPGLLYGSTDDRDLALQLQYIGGMR